MLKKTESNFKELDDWSWTMENGRAVLREPLQDPVPYNEASVRLAYNNTIKYRSGFATEEAHQRQLRKYEQGISLFLTEKPLTDEEIKESMNRFVSNLIRIEVKDEHSSNH